jgi:hypothetical protein
VNDSKTIEGRWWIFGVNSDPHFGVLNYDPESGLTLVIKISRSFARGETLASATEKETALPSVIVGRDKHDKPISVLTAGRGGTSKSGGLFMITIHAWAALLGYEVTSWSEARFDLCGADITLLHNWMSRSRITIGQPNDGAQTISLAKPESLEIELARKVRLRVWQKLDSTHHRSGLELVEDDSVEFHFDKAVPVRELLKDYIYAVRRLLTFLTGYPVFPKRIYFGQKNTIHKNHVEFLQQNRGVTHATQNLLPQDMLVNYAEIKHRVSDVFLRWFAMEQQVRDCLNLYFATIFERHLYNHQRFLFLAQALEVYHRTNPDFVNQVQPKAEFKKRKNRVVKAVPDEKDWLNEKLAHANEKTLAQRLQELLNKHADAIPKFIENPQEFADAVKNARNHFTHYSTDKERIEKVADGVDLLRMTDRIRTLLEICILRDLGIDGAPITRLINSLNARSYFTL